MRILLKYETKNNIFSLDYRRVIMSIIKRTLSNIEDGKYFEEYYGTVERRNFTFAVKFPSPKFDKDKIILGENSFNISLSTGDDKLGFIFWSAFLEHKDKSYSGKFDNTYTLKSIQKINERTASSNAVIVKMLSPLCLRKHSAEKNCDIYYSVKDNDFSKESKMIISSQLLKAGFSKEMSENIEIIPINARKTVVRYYGTFIECSIGDFCIKADKAIINYFLRFGIGSRKSAGFGFANLIADGGLEMSV